MPSSQGVSEAGVRAAEIESRWIKRMGDAQCRLDLGSEGRAEDNILEVS